MDGSPIDRSRPSVAYRGASLARLALAGWWIAGGAVIATALSAGWWWPGEVCCHWSLHASIALVPAVMLSAGRRRWPSFAAGLLVIALGTLPALRAATESRAASVESAEALRVAHANLDWSNPLPATAVGLLVEEADLVSLVEVTADDRRLLAGDPRFPHQVWLIQAAPDGDRIEQGNALLSRHPFRVGSIEHLSPAGEALIVAVIDAPSGPLRVLVCHPASPRSPARWAARDRYLETVARISRTSPEPVLVIGDLNCSPASPGWRDLRARSGLRRAGGPAPATWPSALGRFGIAIDQALVDRRLALSPLRAVAIAGSDHRAVRCEVGLARRPQP